MFQDLKEAFKDVFKKQMRPFIYGSIVLTFVILSILLFGFSHILQAWQVSETAWIKTTVTVLGTLAFIIMSVMIFPIIVTFLAGFFFDSALERLAKTSNCAKLRTVPVSESFKISGVVAVKGVLLTLFLVPATAALSFIPLVNLISPVLFYTLNGRLFGQEYFYAVATRYLSFEDAKTAFQQNKAYFHNAGIIIAILMTIPVLNMISPLVGIAFMQRLFLKRKQG